MNDGRIWVARSSDALIGHVNHPSQLLDGGLRVASGDYEVPQHAGHRAGA